MPTVNSGQFVQASVRPGSVGASSAPFGHSASKRVRCLASRRKRPAIAWTDGARMRDVGADRDVVGAEPLDHVVDVVEERGDPAAEEGRDAADADVAAGVGDRLEHVVGLAANVLVQTAPRPCGWRRSAGSTAFAASRLVRQPEWATSTMTPTRFISAMACAAEVADARRWPARRSRRRACCGACRSGASCGCRAGRRPARAAARPRPIPSAASSGTPLPVRYRQCLPAFLAATMSSGVTARATKLAQHVGDVGEPGQPLEQAQRVLALLAGVLEDAGDAGRLPGRLELVSLGRVARAADHPHLFAQGPATRRPTRRPRTALRSASTSSADRGANP